MHVTQCPECKFQYRIPASHLEMIVGRTASCKRCRARFLVAVRELPDAVMTAGEERETKASQSLHQSSSGADTDDPNAKTSRRSQLEIRNEQIQKLKLNFRALHPRLSEINKEKSSSEEEVRRWLVDVLRHALGYEDHDIRTEERANERKTDITVRASNEKMPTIVVEVKCVRHPLNQRVIEQVASYAAILDAPYALITNGDAWIFFKCNPKSSKNKMIEIFNIALLDEDGVSDNDAESLYLLTKKSLTSGYTERQCHQIAAVQPARLWKSISDEAVLSKLSRTISAQYEEETGVKIEIAPERIINHLKNMVIPDSL